MANFLPLKKAILFCLDKLIAEYDLKPEFLDVGCGIGDVASFLAEKGWMGKAIDVSPGALEKARQNLASFPGVHLEKKDFFDETGKYSTVFLLDILEHIAEDDKALQKLVSLVSEGGYAVLVVPSNPRYWRWDDDFYGHVRRYTAKGIKRKLENVGLETVVIWDFTFPVFWTMRQVYTKFKQKLKDDIATETMQTRTRKSGMAPQWQNFAWVDWMGGMSFFWDCIYKFQFKFFKYKVRWGHELIVLAKKRRS